MNFDDLINELSRDVERVEKLPGKEVTDKTEILVSLCVNLEAIFKSGLKSSFKITALSYREYWHFFKDISYYGKKRRNIDLYFCSLVEKISQEKSVITNSGRGRLIIRSLLKNRMLSNLFKFIRENNDIVAKNYYKDNALLLSSSFLFKINDIILRLDKCLFSINLLNSDFLEISWYLPIYEKFQFVPCKSLGLSIRSISGHHFIELIDPFGVVGENGKLISGDIVSRIFDNSIRFYPGLIRNLLELYKNKPISIWVCKLYRSDGNLYQPILDILNRENMTKIIHKKIPTNPQVNGEFKKN